MVEEAVLGLVMFHIFINDILYIVGLSTPSESLQMMSSLVVQLLYLRKGMPCRGTLTALKSGPI